MFEVDVIGRARRRYLRWLLVGAVLSACDKKPQSPGEMDDGPVDAEVPDAALMDGGKDGGHVEDAEVPDANETDGGHIDMDGGLVDMDGGHIDVDGGHIDMDGGHFDAEVPDAGLNDADLPDAAEMPDGNATDAGVCAEASTCVDECELGLHDCDDSPGGCTDTVDGFACACPSTHIRIGDGQGTLGCASRVIGLHAGYGGSAMCALLAGGRVQCWGGNDYGQLGLGDILPRGDSLLELVSETDVVDLGTGRTAKALSVGNTHACAILDDDSVKCWGGNSGGQLGLGAPGARGDGAGELGDALPAVYLGAGRTAKSISAGMWHTCAVLDDGTLKCWGDNRSGQLGRDNTTILGTGATDMINLTPVVLGAGRTAKQVSAGFDHTCAILDDDTVKCWGGNTYGQLGLGSTATHGDVAGHMAALPTVDLGTGLTAKAISAGYWHTCALLNNDTVKCWGRNASGELGIDSETDRGDGPDEMGDALPTVLLGAGRTAKAMFAGGSHSCAVLDNDTVKCWGLNNGGQLGQGHTSGYGDEAGSMATLSAVELGTGRTARALANGFMFNCALLDNERIKCWGTNNEGRLGQGDTVRRGDGPGEMGDALIYSRLGG